MGGLAVDELRLLHFSFAESTQSLPLESEIFYISNTQILLPVVEETPGFKLARELCLDGNRNAGRFLSVYFMGHSLRLPSLTNIPEEHCASSQLCPLEALPICNGLANQCEEENEGGCVSFNIREVAEENGATAVVPIIDSFLYYFRDNVLWASVKGKSYIKDYYKLGKWVKKDLVMVLKYGTILPKVYSVIDDFQNADGTEVLMNSGLANDILDLISDHRDVMNDEFQSLLDRMQTDVALFRNKTKSEVLSILIDP